MGKRVSPLSQPGPHGYPMRFGVRCTGLRGYKIYGASRREPMRYIECHIRRFILHESAHKKPDSPALVTVHKNWSPGSEFPDDDRKPAYSITIHGRDGTTTNPTHTSPDGTGTSEPTGSAPDPTADQMISLTHAHCRPVTFRFQLPIATASVTTLETFEWRRGPNNCHETRGIRSKKLPAIKTGDPRPPPEKRIWFPNGSILVRMGNHNDNNDTGVVPAVDTQEESPDPTQHSGQHPDTTTPTHPQHTNPTTTPTGLQPLGFTPTNEEILASYTTTLDYHAHIYFQFWGSAAAGELGETFTHVAVASGLAVWQDELAERRARGEGGKSVS
ncbi:hypothetical protein C8A05DRAFT_44177 [Staphylotrichum tortipilum]|uniref:Uncharacterized protein n=1 Tax=Staphylotrichum tortipilum TaxID=2831512 RepID=A0AAN6MLE2_9PEZI|nr:hypothetical protein C8A05DRAFT_44177 [Staphylotrichum longicolle]